MISRIATALFFILFFVWVITTAVPEIVLGVVALIAGIAVAAGQ